MTWRTPQSYEIYDGRWISWLKRKFLIVGFFSSNLGAVERGLGWATQHQDQLPMAELSCLMADGPMRSRSPIIIEGDTSMIENSMRPIHPGEILLEEFLKFSSLSINANRLARLLM